MKLFRVNALIERDMRKFFRSPALMMASMVFPLVQLVVLGYAFGGHVKGAVIGVVDQDHTVQSRRIREMFERKIRQRNRKSDGATICRNLEIINSREADPKCWTVRELAKKHHLSQRAVKRILHDRQSWRRRADG